MTSKDDINKTESDIENGQSGNVDGHGEMGGPGSNSQVEAEFLTRSGDFDAGGPNDRAGAREGGVSPEVQPELITAEVTPDFSMTSEAASEPEHVVSAQAAQADEDAKKPGVFTRFRARRRADDDKPVSAHKIACFGVETDVAPTFFSRIFNMLSLGAIFVLTAIFLVQVLPGLQTERLLWFSDELCQADILAGVFNGHWLQLQLNGQPYQELPPLYFWFLLGLHKLMALSGLDLGSDYARLLYIGAAVSGLLLLWATYALARFTARLDRRCAFSAGCVLVSVLFLQFFFHYSSVDLFFAAFIITGHIFMFRALMRERAPLCMGLAFLCAAVAMLSKGVLGLALPVLSAVLFSLWRGKPQRLFKSDFLLGLAFALLPAMIWLGSIWADGRHDAVVQMLRDQVWVKALGDAGHKEPWWYYLALLPSLFAPWCLILLALPWHRLFSSSVWSSLKSARTGERQGLAFVWIFFLGTFALISLIQHKQPVYVLPLLGPLSVLTGRGALQLSPLRSALLQRLMALLFFLLAVTFVLLPVYYSGNIPSVFSWLENIRLPAWEVKISGIFLLAVIMLGSTCLLIGLVKARRPESTLLILVLSAMFFSYPLSTMTMPALDSVVSSKAASVELRRYADLGYYPVSFKVHSGVFSYYSGLVLNETDDWAELDRMVGVQPKIAVIMAAARWQDWTQHQGFIEVMRFWMLSNEYVLLLRDTLREKTPPARLPPAFQPAPEPDGELPPDSSWPDEAEPAESPSEPPANVAGPKSEPPASVQDHDIDDMDGNMPDAPVEPDGNVLPGENDPADEPLPGARPQPEELPEIEDSPADEVFEDAVDEPDVEI